MVGLGLLAILVQAIAIGVFAQKRLGRTGIVWALVALALSGGAMLVVDAARSQTDPTIPQDAKDLTAVIMVLGFSTVVTMIVLLTLPRKGRA